MFDRPEERRILSKRSHYNSPFRFFISENRKVLNDVEYFDFNEKKWRVIAPMIIPRKLAGSAILDGQLYAVGGINREYADLVTVESYNPCVGQWTSVTSLNKCKGNYPVRNRKFKGKVS